jgi:hypothetical protein
MTFLTGLNKPINSLTRMHQVKKKGAQRSKTNDEQLGNSYEN